MSLDRSIVKKKPKKFKRMFRNDITYSFTFNFNDTFQYFDENSVRRIHELIKSTKLLTHVLDSFAIYEIYPEYSTPSPVSCLSKNKGHSIVGNGYGNKGCRFHYHGLLKFSDVMTFYNSGYYNLLKYGLFEIDTIDDEVLWKSYCTKDKELMEPYFKSYKIIYPIRKSDFIKQKGKIKSGR